mgnify:CR=1 FL=1
MHLDEMIAKNGYVVITTDEQKQYSNNFEPRRLNKQDRRNQVPNFCGGVMSITNSSVLLTDKDLHIDLPIQDREKIDWPISGKVERIADPFSVTSESDAQNVCDRYGIIEDFLGSSDYKKIEKSMELSMYWAKRSKKAFGTNLNKSLFGIVQGGKFDDLRTKSINELVKIGFDGYAIGGLAVGESQNEMFEVLDNLVDDMPKDKPRYLMGVGTPTDILGAVKRGIDMFDCVLPTRSGRTGLAFTWNGRINIRNSKYKYDNKPIDQNTKVFDLYKYSKNYINHLFNTNEMLGSMILTLHNVNFYQELMFEIRKNIERGTYSKFHDKYINVL